MLNFKKFKRNSLRLGFGICASALAFVVSKRIYQVHCNSPNINEPDMIITNSPSISPKLPRHRNHRKLKPIDKQLSLKQAIDLSRDLVERVKDESGAPGIIVGVSINGKSVWEEGIGYSDVENRVKCSNKTVMRIASISKSLTAVAAAKLWENGQLDLDKPVNQYLNDYPDIKFNNEKVNVTSRQLLSHTSGIRHYHQINSQNGKQNSNQPEFLLKEKYDSVTDSLSIFKNDPLLFKPGTKYNYTTFGYTLLSAIIEKTSNETFPIHMNKMFRIFGMKNTLGDVNDVLIYNRSHYYVKGVNGKLFNAPFVDNSYKWAGGGFISTVGDLLKFANIMLYSAQTPPATEDVGSNNIIKLPGFLKQSTMKMLWSTVVDPQMVGGNIDHGYGLGWCVVTEEQKFGGCHQRPYYVYHTGGACGASSILLALPNANSVDLNILNEAHGVCVAVIANLQNVSFTKTALEIAEIFKNVKKIDNTMHIIVSHKMIAPNLSQSQTPDMGLQIDNAQPEEVRK